MSGFASSNNPSVFRDVPVGYGNRVHTYSLTPQEAGIVSGSAQRYGPEFAAVAAQAHQWVDVWRNSPDRRYAFPPEARHLGDGFDAVAFACDIQGTPLVVRVPNTVASPAD